MRQYGDGGRATAGGAAGPVSIGARGARETSGISTTATTIGASAIGDTGGAGAGPQAAATTASGMDLGQVDAMA